MTGKLVAPRRRAGSSDAPAIPALRDRVMPEILRRLEAGESMNAICKTDGMPNRVTVRGWQLADPVIAELVQDARETGLIDRAEKAVQAAKSATDAQLGRLAFDAERWYIGKLSIAFAERPAKIENQTNVQVNIDGSHPFGRLAEFLDSAAAAIAGGAHGTRLVVADGEAGSNHPARGLDDVADPGGSRLGKDSDGG